MQKIIPHLWFDKEAKEAAEFYTSVFSNSKVTNVTTLHDTPSGDCDVVSFEIRGKEFMAISAGPIFKLNPSISFIVNFDPAHEKDASKNIDAAWKKLSHGGKVLMELDKYPFSEKYGWVEDKYGVSWQLILTDPKSDERPEIIPSLLFVQEAYGKAEEALRYYLSVFKDSKMGSVMKYEQDQGPEKAGTVMFADFKLLDTWFAAMDSAQEHKFMFNEAVSLIVNCKDQEEIDYYWEKLSHYPESEQCGWCKDKFGVVWQIVPEAMQDMMQTEDQEKLDRVTQAFLPMKKLVIADLERAAEGK